MKRIIIAGTSVITVIAIGTALASAFSKNTGAYGLNATTASVMPGSAHSLYQLEVAALKSQGIPQARAVEALNTQNEVWKAGFAHKIEAALGSSYAGMWFDNANAQLHVGVTSPAAQRTVERLAAQTSLTHRVVETPVRSPWNQLRAALSELDRELGSLLPRTAVMTGITAPGNAVVITLSPSVTISQRDAVTHDAATVGVNVSTTVASQPFAFHEDSATNECNEWKESEAYCNKTLTAGVTIGSAASPPRILCTAGPMVIPRASKGETYMLTAGHCISKYGRTGFERSRWYSSNRSKEAQEIGSVVEFINGTKGDIAVVKINNPGYWVESTKDPVFANTAEWGTKNPETTYSVAGERVPITNGVTCHEGSTTGQTCGLVSKEAGPLSFLEGTREGLIEVTGTVGELYCQSGDSGGPWLSILTKSNNEALMEGTLVGSEAAAGPCYYEPLSKAYSLLGSSLELLTKGNENRPKG